MLKCFPQILKLLKTQRRVNSELPELLNDVDDYDEINDRLFEN